MKITDLSLKKEIAQALEERGYEDFTAIQEMTLPALLNGEDVIAEAPTGTGKTAAYCLPMLTRIDATNPAVQALVLKHFSMRTDPARARALIQSELPESWRDRVRVLLPPPA